MPEINGYCPMGCGKTLIVTAFGDIMCVRVQCPRPFAMVQILEDAQETGHIVEFMDDGYNCKHPLWERLDDQLLTCLIGDRIESAHMADPDLRGTYRYDGHMWEELV